MQTLWKRLAMATLVAATLLVGAGESRAGWWHGCYAGGWTSYYGGYYGGYLVPRGGPLRRLFLGPYRYVPAYYTGCYSSYYWPSYSSCCYTPCYSSCCSCYSCYDCCYTSYDCCWPATTTVTVPAANTPTPASPPTPPPPPSKDAAPADGNPGGMGPEPTTSLEVIPEQVQENSGQITIWVPFDAKVLVNGLETKSTGSRRRYVSHGLVDGYRYKYEIVARIERDGQTREEKETVILSAGSDASVAFGFTKPEAELAQTF